MSRTKYNATRYIDGEERFDSKKEYLRWKQLKKEYDEGKIFMLERQVEFELIPRQKDEWTGKVLERACKYKADFVYRRDGVTIVEDVKGYKTEVYKIKKKLMLYRYGIQIREV